MDTVSGPMSKYIVDDSLLVLRTDAPCHTCKHFEGPDRLACAAFPDRIPNAILAGENQHQRPVQGDRGIIYDPNET